MQVVRQSTYNNAHAGKTQEQGLQVEIYSDIQLWDT